VGQPWRAKNFLEGKLPSNRTKKKEQRTFGGKTSLQQNKEKNKELFGGKFFPPKEQRSFGGKMHSLKNKGFLSGKIAFPLFSRYCATWLIRSYPN